MPHQRPLTETQRAYLSEATDELFAAGIIEPIQPEDIKCASPLTLAQKLHGKSRLSLHKLQHRLNEECILNGHPPVHNIEAPENSNQSLPQTENSTMACNPTQSQKWRICQNYNVLNRVTHVFPAPQGDIH